LIFLQESPVNQLHVALNPIANWHEPVALAAAAFGPIMTLFVPVVMVFPAPAPIAVFPLPVAKHRAFLPIAVIHEDAPAIEIPAKQPNRVLWQVLNVQPARAPATRGVALMSIATLFPDLMQGSIAMLSGRVSVALPPTQSEKPRCLFAGVAEPPHEG
jgi:hypothetical protein